VLSVGSVYPPTDKPLAENSLALSAVMTDVDPAFFEFYAYVPILEAIGANNRVVGFGWVRWTEANSENAVQISRVVSNDASSVPPIAQGNATSILTKQFPADLSAADIDNVMAAHRHLKYPLVVPVLVNSQ
jgi:hypothetical protein